MREKKIDIKIGQLNPLIRAYAVKGDLPGAEQVVKNIKAMGMAVDYISLGHLLHACSYSGDTISVEKILAEAVNAGMKIGTFMESFLAFRIPCLIGTCCSFDLNQLYPILLLTIN